MDGVATGPVTAMVKYATKSADNDGLDLFQFAYTYLINKRQYIIYAATKFIPDVTSSHEVRVSEKSLAKLLTKCRSYYQLLSII